jgi:hypothetical protein
MGERARRGAGIGLAAVTAAVALPAGAAAIAPGSPVDRAAPTVDRRAAAATAPAAVRDARAALRRSVGPQLALGVDPDTGATRSVQRLDGALTAPAAGDRREVARGWLRANRALFGSAPTTWSACAWPAPTPQGPPGSRRCASRSASAASRSSTAA